MPKYQYDVIAEDRQFLGLPSPEETVFQWDKHSPKWPCRMTDAEAANWAGVGRSRACYMQWILVLWSHWVNPHNRCTLYARQQHRTDIDL
jgi:hypothetical protein